MLPGVVAVLDGFSNEALRPLLVEWRNGPIGDSRTAAPGRTDYRQAWGRQPENSQPVVARARCWRKHVRPFQEAR